MCRNIKTLFNFEPRVPTHEVRAAYAPVRPQAQRLQQAVEGERGGVRARGRSTAESGSRAPALARDTAPPRDRDLGGREGSGASRGAIRLTVAGSNALGRRERDGSRRGSRAARVRCSLACQLEGATLRGRRSPAARASSQRSRPYAGDRATAAMRSRARARSTPRARRSSLSFLIVIGPATHCRTRCRPRRRGARRPPPGARSSYAAYIAPSA